jgi:hypothetical protein
MPTFSVILEDVTMRSASGRTSHDITNQRVETIDADDINDAWVQARRQYYTLKVDGPDTQIVDIEPGTTSIEKRAEEMETKPLPVSTAEAPPTPKIRG